MRRMIGLLILMCFVLKVAHADVFASKRPSDTALRRVLADDRDGFYMSTPGIVRQESVDAVSELGALSVDGMMRPQGLRDMDRAFDLFLREQLRADRDYQNIVDRAQPLLLLEYASPVTADVLKHYRMSAYERLLIEQLRLLEIERTTQGAAERLSAQSEKECLRRNESRGLVAAMRACQRAPQAFDSLVSVDGQTSLQDGRRRIHVVAQALGRLGLERARIDRIIDLTGDRVISDNGLKDVLPETGFGAAADIERQSLVRRWQEALERWRSSRRVTAAPLEELSLAGVPVTVRVLAELDLLDDDERQIMVMKLSSCLALAKTAERYRDAAGYLRVCAADPVLPDEFRRVLLEKEKFVLGLLDGVGSSGLMALEYKDLLASLAAAADIARQRLNRFQVPRSGSQVKELMLNF